MDSTEIIVIELAKPGRDGDYAGATEVAALKTRADALEARPNITSLDAVPDVATSGAADGDALLYDADDTTTPWKPGTPVGKINGVYTAASGGTYTQVSSDTTEIYTNTGIVSRAGSGGSHVAVLEVNFAGTGTENTVAHADHWHTTASKQRVAYTGGGYLSSGSRPIGSMSVTLTNGVTYLVEAWPEGQLRGSDAGAAYYRISITINGNTRTSGSSKKWVVQGVPNDPLWSHEQTITGTGAAISISASVLYDSGAGLSVDDGELVVRLTPSR